MNLTDKEIIKALGCCGNSISEGNKCAKCPMCDEPYGCSKVLCSQAVDLINRLQDEREALINGQETLQNTIVEKSAEVNELQLKVKLARDFMDLLREGQNEIYQMAIKAKAEAIKEFAERLKSKQVITHKSKEGYCVYEYDDELIDNLVKEMTEQKE